VEVVTREANASDLDRAAEVLGEAFADYPWTRWTVDASNHQQRITALQRIALEHFALPFGAVSVTTAAGVIASVVAWSDSAALSLENVDATVSAQVAELEGRRHAASKSADDQVEHLRPRKHHLYLGTVGTSRAMQGRGLATKTLAPLLQISDRNAVEVWLETSSESNVDFYRRLGFGVERHLAIQGGGPAVWVMSRQPATGPDTATPGSCPSAPDRR
jgi:ribosomal protein S18 acetylase RimI-like enzyme